MGGASPAPESSSASRSVAAAMASPSAGASGVATWLASGTIVSRASGQAAWSRCAAAGGVTAS